MEERQKGSMQKEHEGPEKRSEVWLYIAVVIVAASACIAIYLYRREFGTSLSPQQEVWGQFGDFFGGIFNPVLSFLALLAVLASLRSQSIQLQAARSEAQAARDEARVAQSIQAQQTRIFERQSKLIERQSFETVFFSLLQLHSRNMQEIKVWNGNVWVSGLQAIEYFVGKYNVDRALINGACERTPESQLVEHAESFRDDTAGKLDAYFGVLQQLLQYVDDIGKESVGLGIVASVVRHMERQMGAGEEERLQKMYGSVVASFLSPFEKELIVLKCLSEDGGELAVLAEKYGLLGYPSPRINGELARAVISRKAGF